MIGIGSVIGHVWSVSVSDRLIRKKLLIKSWKTLAWHENLKKKLDLYCRTITNVKIRNYPWWHHVESEVTYALLCHLQLFIYVVKQAGENSQKFEEFLQGSLTGRRRAKPGSLVTTKVSASARPTISWNGDFDALPTRSRWDDGRILTFNYL